MVGKSKHHFPTMCPFVPISVFSSNFVCVVLDQREETNLVRHQKSIALTVDTQLFIDMLPVLSDGGCGYA